MFLSSIILSSILAVSSTGSWPAATKLADLENAVFSDTSDRAYETFRHGLQEVPKNTTLLVPFYRRLLSHKSPKVRGEAVFLLQQNLIFLSLEELPKSFIMGPVPEFFPANTSQLDAFAKKALSWDAGGWQLSCLAAAKAEAGLGVARELSRSKNVFSRYRAALALFEYGEIEEGGQVLREIAFSTDSASKYYRYSALRTLILDGNKSAISELFKLSLLEYQGDVATLDDLADLTTLGYVSNSDWTSAWSTTQSRAVIEEEVRRAEGISLERIERTSSEFAETDEFARAFFKAIVAKDGRTLAALSNPDYKPAALNNYAQQITDPRNELSNYFFAPTKSLRQFFTSTKEIGIAYFEHKKSQYEHWHIICYFDASERQTLPIPNDFYKNLEGYQLTLQGKFCMNASKWNNWKIRSDFNFPIYRNE